MDPSTLDAPSGEVADPPAPTRRPAGRAGAAFEARLRRAHPHPWATLLLVGATAAAYLLQSAAGGRWLEADTDLLVASGAGYGPRLLGGGEWWRAVSAVFLHAGLSHAAVNVGFLLLIGRWAERLVGPLVFLGAYLFAGACGTLLSVGWFPLTPTVGASGAVYGAYGLLFGAWVRGCRRVPIAFVGRLAAGAAVMLAAQLAVDGLTRVESQVAHLGGLAAGAAAGLVAGPSGKLRGHRPARTAVRFGGLALVVAAGVWGCGRLAAWGAEPPLTLRQPLEPAVDRERELLTRLDGLIGRWADRTVTDQELAAELRREHLVGWARFSHDHRLEWPATNLVPAESALQSLRRLPLRSPAAPEPPPTAEELREALALITAARVEALTALASGLEGPGSTMEQWADLLTVEAFRQAVDDTANEGNRLQQLVNFSRGQRPPAADRRTPPH